MATKNLIPFCDLTEKEQRKIASKGGKSSVKARREKKTLRAALELLLEGKTDGDMSRREAVAIALMQKAMSGDVRAFEVLRDTVGEKPVEKAENTNTDTVKVVLFGE